MEILQAFILGLVQGLTEFLPISSSAHLVLVPWVFNFDDPGLAFDLALHWGSLLAVLLYFRNDIYLIAKGFFHSLVPSTRDLQNNIYQKLSWLIILATIPAAVIGKILEEYAEEDLRKIPLIAINLAVFGVVIFFVDRFGKKEKNLDRIKWEDALVVGFSQALAIIPGVSRSGATMAAGLALGFKRSDAARFSFLMSVPIIFGAGLLKLPEFTTGISIPQLIVGFISSAVFGFLAIKYLIKYLSNHDFKVFAGYRLVVAVLILLVYFVRIY